MNLLLLLASSLSLSTRTPSYITEAQAEWEGLAEVTVVTRSCGEENAYYYPADQMVVMCKELYRDPQLAVHIFNHEMGHAFMDQHDIRGSERGADELAMLFDTPDQLAAGAKWHLKMHKLYPHDPSDVHQSDLERAASLLCYMDGTDERPVKLECVAYAASLQENWNRMLYLVME